MEMVARYFNSQLAELARGALEAAGIPALVHSSRLASIIGPDVLGGLRIEVPESAISEAREILRTIGGDDDRDLF